MAAIEAFEQQHAVSLPESYRRYVTELGIGGWRALSILEDWCQPYDA